MKTRFKTPVSMKCTQEQYDKDLKEPLRKLGYVEKYAYRYTKKFKYLVTNYYKESSFLGIVTKEYAVKEHHLIKTS